MLIFGAMLNRKTARIIVEQHVIKSAWLQRDVKVDYYLPSHIEQSLPMGLLLINDGQDLVTMQFQYIHLM